MRDTWKVACPKCGAKPGTRCTSKSGRIARFKCHAERTEIAKKKLHKDSLPAPSLPYADRPGHTSDDRSPGPAYSHRDPARSPQPIPALSGTNAIIVPPRISASTAHPMLEPSVRAAK